MAAKPPEEFDQIQSAGLLIFTLPLVFCSMEIVPGWGLFHLTWPAGVYYAIMAVAGGVGGALVGKRYWLPGLISGPLVGIGSLFADALLLSWTTVTTNWFLVLAGLIGALPGLGLGYGLAYLQKLLFPVTAIPAKVRRPARAAPAGGKGTPQAKPPAAKPRRREDLGP